jgi:hypothetical protein
MCSFFFPVVFVDFFNSLGSEQTKIYRAEILFCCGAIRVVTKFEVRMSMFFLGGRLGQITFGDKAIGCPSQLAEIQSQSCRRDCCLP